MESYIRSQNPDRGLGCPDSSHPLPHALQQYPIYAEPPAPVSSSPNLTTRSKLDLTYSRVSRTRLTSCWAFWRSALSLSRIYLGASATRRVSTLSRGVSPCTVFSESAVLLCCLFCLDLEQYAAMSSSFCRTHCNGIRSTQDIRI
jgi:hypothetical protein